MTAETQILRLAAISAGAADALVAANMRCPGVDGSDAYCTAWKALSAYLRSMHPAPEPRCPSCGAREQQHCVGIKRNQPCEWEKRR